ncbi:MAG: DsbA family protein [Treponema sp.]|jgi:predicted DsbA family dithiol-disulfide isomerase|nr:DsbA family protein [Treponema sp.]
MKKLRIFYDYECPYCKRGYEDFLECAPGAGIDEIEWRPVEAHPRPETHGPHTDLACQAYYIARELEADMAAFHAAMFQATAIERRNVEDPEILAKILEGIVDGGKFLSILKSGKYAKQVDENNDLAYEKSGVWFLPAFRMFRDGEPAGKLDAEGGIGVGRGALQAFLKA